MKRIIRKRLPETVMLLWALAAAAVVFAATGDAVDLSRIQGVPADKMVETVGGACNTKCMNVCQKTSNDPCSTYNQSCNRQSSGTYCWAAGGTGTAFTQVIPNPNWQANLTGTASCTPTDVCICDGNGTCVAGTAAAFNGASQCVNNGCGG